MARTKILLDTDIGSDSDDALCLLYLLGKADCDLLGVSTVGSDSPARARLADALCRHVGRDEVPIAAGAERPLSPNRYWPGHRVNQADVADRYGAGRTYEPDRALQLMRQTIEDHPGEVVLLTIGMLTNVALLARAYPQTAAKLKAVYTMAGFFKLAENDELRGECNAILDPVASLITFNAALPNHRVVGSNVTRGEHFTGQQVLRHFGAEKLRPLVECARCWMAERGNDPDDPRMGIPDPMTAALVFDDSPARWRRGRVGVKLLDHDLKHGYPLLEDQLTCVTSLSPNETGPHEIAVTVDGAAVRAEVASVVTALGGGA